MRKVINQFHKLRGASRLRRARQLGVHVGRDCRFGAHLDISLGLYENHRGEISIGNQGWIEQGVILWAFGGRIRIGNSVYIGQYSVIYGHGGVEIGEETLVSMHCCILSSNHTIAPRDRIIRQQPDIRLPTKIGRDVWLGAGVKVLGGVTIGDGCVVGAGAVVVKDLSAYSIAVGVPAIVVGQRN